MKNQEPTTPEQAAAHQSAVLRHYGQVMIEKIVHAMVLERLREAAERNGSRKLLRRMAA